MQCHCLSVFSMTFKDVLKHVREEFHLRNLLFRHDDYVILACSPVSCVAQHSYSCN